MKKYLLGIDAGTSACKVAVFDRNGKVVEAANADYPIYYPYPGWVEQNPEDWWMAICKATKELFARGNVSPSDIQGIGIDGQSWSAIPIDDKGNVLANTPIWLDTRCQDICTELNAKIGADDIFQLTGNSLQPTYTTAKILWYERNLPKLYPRIYKILQANSFIAYRLTGAITHDMSQGYGVHCFNMRTGRWDEEMCRKLGIPFAFLPELVPSHAVVGEVHEKAAKESGLAPGIPVVAGALDAACGTLGAGVIDVGETQEQGGQAGGMSICMDEYIADPRLILGYHAIPGHWLLQGGTTGGGGVMRWLEKEFGAYEREEGKKLGKSSLARFNDLAGAVPVGSDGLTFLPYMAGERSPIWNPHAKGVYYGLDFNKTKGHFIRAAMEGVAFALKHNLDVAKEAGAEVKILRAMGGAANSLLWTQIKSDICNVPIVVPSSDTATTLGAVILAGVGTGMYSSFKEAVALTVIEKRRHTPNLENQGTYAYNYKIYLELYRNLKVMMTNGKEGR
ncbi:MAG: xylulokinase [Lachnospiraceae bacterium]|nr:xylulokinase [Lachnospiraceae bacterium]